VNRAPAIFHAVVDGSLVNSQYDVIHNLYGGASLVSLKSASAEFSFCAPSAPPTYAFKLIDLRQDKALLQILAGTQVTTIS
jgi:hypothetical protein